MVRRRSTARYFMLHIKKGGHAAPRRRRYAEESNPSNSLVLNHTAAWLNKNKGLINLRLIFSHPKSRPNSHQQNIYIYGLITRPWCLKIISSCIICFPQTVDDAVAPDGCITFTTIVSCVSFCPSCSVLLHTYNCVLYLSHTSEERQHNFNSLLREP